MAGKTTTERIERLESLAADLSARIDVHEATLQRIVELQKKGEETTTGHTSRIIVVEQQLVMLVDLRNCIAAVTAIEKELVAIRKDLESLQKWKDDLKKEKEEGARRLWAFGPNFLAAIVSGIIALIGVGLSVGLTYWLTKP